MWVKGKAIEPTSPSPRPSARASPRPPASSVCPCGARPWGPTRCPRCSRSTGPVPRAPGWRRTRGEAASRWAQRAASSMTRISGGDVELGRDVAGPWWRSRDDRIAPAPRRAPGAAGRGRIAPHARGRRGGWGSAPRRAESARESATVSIHVGSCQETTVPSPTPAAARLPAASRALRSSWPTVSERPAPSKRIGRSGSDEARRWRSSQMVCASRMDSGIGSVGRAAGWAAGSGRLSDRLGASARPGTQTPRVRGRRRRPARTSWPGGLVRRRGGGRAAAPRA